VAVDTYLVDDDPVGIVLGIPRQQVLATQSGQVVVFVAGWRGRNLFLGTPTGSQMVWHDTLSLTNNPQISDADYHTHLSLDHDTIYAAVPPPGGDSMLVKVIGITGGELVDVAYSFTGAYRGSGGWDDYTVYRGGVWFVPGTDTAILVTRGHDGAGNDVMDIVSFISADRARIWSDSLRVIDLKDAADQTRIGGMNFFNGTVSALIFAREEGGVLWYNWNRSTRRWVGEANLALSRHMDRGYSGNVIGSTGQFVVCCNTAAQNRDTIFYAWKSLGQTNWQQGALEAGQFSSDNWLHADLVYIEQSQRLVLFHQQYSANAADSLRLYCRYWRPGSAAWSGPTLVSTGRAALHVSPCLRTPAGHGDVAYVSYHQINAATSQAEVNLARVRFTENVEPCVCIGSTGNIDCAPDDSVTMSDLTVLIDYLFVSLSPLCCEAEAYLDDMAEVSMGDLTVLVDHLFITFEPLPTCQ
jgi:hypothetical protein